MIIYRSFYKEATVTTLATMLVLVVLVLSQKAVLVLSSAALGNIKATWVMTLLMLDLVLDFDLLMQLSLFIGVLATLSRWYRDSEMVVLTSCGVGIMELVRPVMMFTLGVALLVAVLVMAVRPAANLRIQDVRQENANKADLGIIPAGRFTSVSGYTYYIRKVEASGAKGGIFIHSKESTGSQTIVAESARQYTDIETGQRVISLASGAVYQGEPGKADYRITRFDRYELVAPGSKPAKAIDHVESIPFFELLDFPDRNRALTEMQTRLGKPFLLFIFAGIAMVLSYADPRRSHYRSLFAAVVVFFFYLTLLQFVRDMMKAGQVSPIFAMWVVHGIAVLIIYRLLLRRSNGLPLIPPPGKPFRR